jgi:hypothetical protein
MPFTLRPEGFKRNGVMPGIDGTGEVADSLSTTLWLTQANTRTGSPEMAELAEDAPDIALAEPKPIHFDDLASLLSGLGGP